MSSHCLSIRLCFKRSSEVVILVVPACMLCTLLHVAVPDERSSPPGVKIQDCVAWNSYSYSRAEFFCHRLVSVMVRPTDTRTTLCLSHVSSLVFTFGLALITRYPHSLSDVTVRFFHVWGVVVNIQTKKAPSAQEKSIKHSFLASKQLKQRRQRSRRRIDCPFLNPQPSAHLHSSDVTYKRGSCKLPYTAFAHFFCFTHTTLSARRLLCGEQA